MGTAIATRSELLARRSREGIAEVDALLDLVAAELNLRRLRRPEPDDDPHPSPELRKVLA